MKIELGKTKIKGFRFRHLTEGVVWDKQIEKYIYKEGVIMSIHHEHIYQSMRVKFEDGNSYAYPLEMAKKFLIEEETIYTKQQKIISEPSEGIKEILTKINNKNNMKNLKITAPEGYEIDKTNSTFENIVFKPIKKELPKSWEELSSFEGFIYNGTIILTEKNYIPCHANRRFFATKEQAEASIALAQLSQLREVYRDGWKPEDGVERYIIIFQNNKIVKDWAKYYGYFLSFQSTEVRDLFLENFRSLIEQAKPLMS